MVLTRIESMALIADGLRRAAELEVDDLHLGLGIALQDQLDGRRQRRLRSTRKSIRGLTGLLRSEEDRMLALAFPTFTAVFDDYHVHVLTEQDTSAPYYAANYGLLADELKISGGVGLLHSGQSAAETEQALAAAVVVGDLSTVELCVASAKLRPTAVVLDSSEAVPAVKPYCAAIAHLI